MRMSHLLNWDLKYDKNWPTSPKSRSEQHRIPKASHWLANIDPEKMATSSKKAQ